MAFRCSSFALSPFPQIYIPPCYTGTTSHFLFALCPQINPTLVCLCVCVWLALCLRSICCAPGRPLLPQLPVPPSASDEHCSGQSMSLPPLTSTQPILCHDSGPSAAHSSPGVSRQVSAQAARGCLCIRFLTKALLITRGYFHLWVGLHDSCSVIC